MPEDRGAHSRAGSRVGARPQAESEPREPLRRRLPGGAAVLVVDDEDAIREFLCAALEAEGYNVLAARDGLDALSQCERHQVDVVLLDLMMPRLDGFGFLTIFWQRFAADRSAVFVMSAVRSAVDRVAGESVAGAFVKPFDLDDLLDRIAAYLAVRPMSSRVTVGPP